MDIGLAEQKVSIGQVAAKLKRRSKTNLLAKDMLDTLMKSRACVQPLIDARNDFVHWSGMSVFARPFVEYQAEGEFTDARTGEVRQGRAWSMGGDLRWSRKRWRIFS